MLFSPSQVFRFHLGVIIMLGIGYAIVVIASLHGSNHLFGLADMFRVSYENNAPTLFSVLALFATAIAALVVRKALPSSATSERIGWAIVAAGFVFLGLDEWFEIHEAVEFTTFWAGSVGFALLVLPVVLFLIPFWLKQSASVRNGMFLGALVFGISAVGLEIVEWQLFFSGMKYDSAAMQILAGFEELGEMLGVAIVLRAFLTRFSELGGGYIVPGISASSPSGHGLGVAK